MRYIVPNHYWNILIRIFIMNIQFHQIIISFLFVFILATLCCKNESHIKSSSNRLSTPAIGRYGMVSSAHPIATEAGLDILKTGGNAFDAAISVVAVLNVVEPMMSGIGGYGTIIIYDAEKCQARFLDSSGKIPQAVDSDVFRAPTPNYLENRQGPKAVSTPGNVNAWEAMSRQYGKLNWNALFDAAIEVAEQGFVISEATAAMIAVAFPSFPEHARLFYGRNNEPLRVGERLIQKDLARSLRLIAEQGAKAVYGGEIGEAIDKAMKDSDGFLCLKDLIDDRAEWWEPISINYRGYEVITASPPSTAFPSLIRLGMMSRFDVKKMGHNSATYLHYFAEVTKHAFWCRLAYAGDPEINPPPLDKLLSEKYWKEQAAKIDPQRAKPFEPPQVTIQPEKHTTHFVVADKWGNIVCATQTLGNLFGSRIMPEGTGIWLNNSLAYCTFEPKGNPMDAHAGHRKLSGDCPTLIIKNGKPWVAIGTPGGHTIGQTVPQMVMNLIDFRMDIQLGIAAARISFVEPDIIVVEPGIPESIRDELTGLGHNIKVRHGIGNAHGLTIEYNEKGNPIKFMGGSDPRGQGLAKGL
jgi:gamma-glutamyltranspeptidase/glutathione hydrolase